MMSKRERRKKTGSLLDYSGIRILLCIVVPVVVFGILLLSKGNNPIVVYKVMLLSVFGSLFGIGEVVVRATPLVMTSMTSILPARVGLANAGGEGQLAGGAIAAAFFGSRSAGWCAMGGHSHCVKNESQNE